MGLTRRGLTVAALILLPGVASAQDGARTRRVSVSQNGEAGNLQSRACDLARDAEVVAFDSFAGNFVPRDTNDTGDVFVSDRAGGVERVSVTSEGRQARTENQVPSISAGGRFVVFTSTGYNLRDARSGSRLAVFLHDRRTGRTVRASDRSDGRRVEGHAHGHSISNSGRYVAFISQARDLAMRGDHNGMPDVFVHDRKTRKTNRVSLSRKMGDPDGGSTTTSISGDGRYVAFGSYATNLVRGDDNGHLDVFVYDRAARETELVSIWTSGEQADDQSYDPSISADGRYVAFTSYGPLAETDAAYGDVYVHDRLSGETEHVSVGAWGPGNALSVDPSISDDGRYVAFTSIADNLVEGDTNGTADVFVRDRVEGKTIRVSVGDEGQEADAWGMSPAISPDGGYVCWSSPATNLDDVPDEHPDREDVYLRGPLF